MLKLWIQHFQYDHCQTRCPKEFGAFRPFQINHTVLQLPKEVHCSSKQSQLLIGKFEMVCMLQIPLVAASQIFRALFITLRFCLSYVNNYQPQTHSVVCLWWYKCTLCCKIKRFFANCHCTIKWKSRAYVAMEFVNSTVFFFV